MKRNRGGGNDEFYGFPYPMFDFHSVFGILMFIVVIILALLCLFVWIYCAVVGGTDGTKVLIVGGVVSGIILLISLLLCIFVGYEKNSKRFFSIAYPAGVILSVIGLYIFKIQIETPGLLRVFELVIESVVLMLIPILIICWLRYAIISIAELFIK